METLRIGIIGCGNIARVHLDAIKKDKHAILVAVCDLHEERAKQVAEEYQCDYTADYQQLINRQDIDVIHILTPHHVHFEMARDTILANKHCLIEKPVTIKTEDAKVLHDLLKERPHLKFTVAFQNRYNTTSQVIKQMIDEKTYGDLLGIRGSVTWFRDKNYYQHDAWRGKWETEGGGVLMNQAIHTLDLIQWFGGTIDGISGQYGTYYLQDVIEVEDTATLFLHFKEGARGLLFATNNHIMNTPVQLELVFKEGIIHLNDGEVWVQKGQASERIAYDQQPSGEKSYWGLSHETLIHQFYKSIRTNQSVDITLSDAAQTIEILEKFYRHANQETYITIENTKEW